MTRFPICLRLLSAFALLLMAGGSFPLPAHAATPLWDRCSDGVTPPPDANCLKAADELREAGMPAEQRQALSRACGLQKVWEACYQRGLLFEVEGDADGALGQYDKACKNSMVMDKACKRAASMRSGAVPGPDEAVRAPDGSERSHADLVAADERRQCAVDRVRGACLALVKKGMQADAGSGKPAQPEAAARYASLLCDMESTEHCQMAGVLLGKGDVMAPDYAAAYRVFSKGCLQQSANACVGAAATAMRLSPPDREASMAAAEQALMLEPDNAKAKAIIERLTR